MARGRMLDQRFTQSDKLNSVSRDARLVYASILPYLDREGRACAEPMAVKVNVFRRRATIVEARKLTRLKPREFRRALQHLEKTGLITRRRDDRGATVWEANHE